MNKTIGFGLAIMAAFFWAIAIVISKYSLENIAPSQLFLIQIISAFSIAYGFAIFMGNRPPTNKKAFLAYATGLFEPFLAYVFSLYGLAIVSAGTASVIFATETIIILLLSLFLIRLRIVKPLVFTGLILLSFIGVCMVVFPEIKGNGTDSLIGYILILVGVFFAALYVVLSSRLIKNYNPTVLLVGQLAFATLLALLFLYPVTTFEPMATELWVLAIISGILQYYLAFFCYLTSMRWISLQVAGAMLYLIPVFGLLLAYIFLGETVTIGQMIGVVVILSSVIYLNYKYE